MQDQGGRRWAKWTILACVACCVTPILGFIGVGGIAGAIGAAFSGAALELVLCLGIPGAFLLWGVFGWWRSKKSREVQKCGLACATDANCCSERSADA